MRGELDRWVNLSDTASAVSASGSDVGARDDPGPGRDSPDGTGDHLVYPFVKGLVYGLIIGSVLGFATCGLAFIVWYPLTVVDAILVANKLNRGQAIKEWEFF
jgi:hypothetical protein